MKRKMPFVSGSFWLFDSSSFGRKSEVQSGRRHRLDLVSRLFLTGSCGGACGFSSRVQTHSSSHSLLVSIYTYDYVEILLRLRYTGGRSIRTVHDVCSLRMQSETTLNARSLFFNRSK